MLCLQAEESLTPLRKGGKKTDCTGLHDKLVLEQVCLHAVRCSGFWVKHFKALNS